MHLRASGNEEDFVNTSTALILAAVWSSVILVADFAVGQEPSMPAEAAVATYARGCVQPAEILSASDYDGRFKQVAAFLTHKVELKTVQKPYSGKDVPICGLNAREKFAVFVRDGSEPLTFLIGAFNGGLAHAYNDDSVFGPGAAGYGQRMGAALADGASGSFFGTFLYPALFKEDPRYYRQLNGGAKRRLGHALTHVVVARADSGGRMFNYSAWLTIASSTALANVYHPGNRRGFGPAATRAAKAVGTNMAVDVLLEFWPEISRKLKLPLLRGGGASARTPEPETGW
jgi:hypothetical protein